MAKDKKKEWEKQAEKIWATLDRVQETLDKVSKEQEAFIKEMQKLREAQERLEKSQQKTDQQIRQLREAQALTDTQVRLTNKNVGNLVNGWGEFVVSIAEPSVLRWIKEELKLKLKEVTRNKELYQDNKIVGEIDLFIEGIREDGSSLLVIVEIKSSFQLKEMRKFKKLLSNLYDYMPDRYRDTKAIAVIAAVRFGNGVKTDALKSGFYVFEVQDDIMRVTEPKRPKVLTAYERVFRQTPGEFFRLY